MKKKVLVALLGALFAVYVCLPLVHAQFSALPIGSIKSVKPLSPCPSGYTSGMTCFQAEMSCPQTVDVRFTFGYENPVGIVNGTIVFFSGSGGTIPAVGDFGLAYLNRGYQIVQLAWNTAWEETGRGTSASIKLAACRPATFLNYVHQNLHSTGGMCAQGSSGGSGAVAYSLAWYGSASFLDNVELLSGPVFSDIEQGCVVPNAPAVTVCPAGQLGCNTGLLGSWQDKPQYIGDNATAMRGWTDDNTCNGGVPTTMQSNQNWKAMSIVDGTSNGSFSYPQTNMAGWLCATSQPKTCDPSTCPNNSAAEGEFFYQQFTNSSQVAAYSVNRIDNCQGAEGVTSGTTPQGINGKIAIMKDMIAHCQKLH
jgi:hypothetical protein